MYACTHACMMCAFLVLDPSPAGSVQRKETYIYIYNACFFFSSQNDFISKRYVGPV